MPGASAPTISGHGRTTGSCASRCGAGRRDRGERYFAVGETDFRRVIEQILAARPSFVFNTLIGESAYQFLRDFRAMAAERGIDQAREIPVASCSLSEPELEAIGGDAVDGHLSSSVYFSSIALPREQRLRHGLPAALSRWSGHVGGCGGLLCRDGPACPRAGLCRDGRYSGGQIRRERGCAFRRHRARSGWTRIPSTPI